MIARKLQTKRDEDGDEGRKTSSPVVEHNLYGMSSQDLFMCFKAIFKSIILNV
jgi:hypothetical protein